MLEPESGLVTGDDECEDEAVDCELDTTDTADEVA